MLRQHCKRAQFEGPTKSRLIIRVDDDKGLVSSEVCEISSYSSYRVVSHIAGRVFCYVLQDGTANTGLVHLFAISPI